MKTLQFLMIFCFAFFIFGNAQVTFQKLYSVGNGTSCNSVKTTSDGGYILAGTTTVPGNQYDMHLTKIDSSGDLEWAKTFGSSENDWGTQPLQTNDGGYILAGHSKTWAAGTYDFLVVKTDATGTIQWSKNYEVFFSNEPNKIEQVSDGGFVYFGIMDYNRAYILKTDNSGNIEWDHAYGGGLTSASGFSGQQTQDGGYIMAGMISDSITSPDVLLIKTDQFGDTLWTKSFGGDDSERVYSIQQTNDGGYVLAGETYSDGAGGSDVFLIKTTENGSLSWAKTYGGSSHERGIEVIQTTDGGFAISGFSNSFSNGDFDYYLIKTDASGSLLWSKIYGDLGGDYARAINQTPDGGFVIAGSTNGFDSRGEKIYLVKTDANGESGCYDGPANTIVNLLNVVNSHFDILILNGCEMAEATTLVGDGGMTTTLCTTVGVFNNESSPGRISITPNPFSVVTKIKMNEVLKDASLDIFNAFGQLKMNIANISGQEIEFFKRDLNNGIYYLIISQDNRIFATEKLIVSD